MSNVTEKFDKDGVVSSMETIGGHFESVGTAYSNADAQMASQLTTPDGAMYGEGATRLLAAWDENSGTLDDFMAAFDNWSALVSGMANHFSSFEDGTYEIKNADLEDLQNKAKAFHTTALKTTAGSAAFLEAQTTYAANNPAALSYDKNGVPCKTIKTLENGKIVETRIYEDEQGNPYAVVEHWEWDEEQQKFVDKPKYYTNFTYDKDAENPEIKLDTATELTEEEFKERYNKNEDTMVEYYRDKYLNKYLENGELTEEDLDKIPEGIRERVLGELDSQSISGRPIYDENGKYQGTIYKDANGNTFEITYKEEDGKKVPVYKVNDEPTDAKSFFEQYQEASDEQKGLGAAAATVLPEIDVVGNPSKGTATYRTADGSQEYVLSQSNGATLITVGTGEDAKTYTVTTDENGNRTYSLIGPNGKPMTVADADKINELNAAMEGFASSDDPYTKGLLGEKSSNIQYGIDDKGNLTKEIKLDDVGKTGTLKVTYDDKGNPEKAVYIDENGETEVPADQIDGYLKSVETKEDGTKVTAGIDSNTGYVTITSEKDGKTTSEITIDRDNNITTETTYEYDGDSDRVATETIKTTKDGETTTEKRDYKYNGDEEIGYSVSGGGSPTYQGKDPKTGEYVTVTEEQFEKLTNPDVIDEKAGTTTSASIKDGRYTETTYSTDNPTHITQEVVVQSNNRRIETSYEYDENDVLTQTVEKNTYKTSTTTTTTTYKPGDPNKLSSVDVVRGKEGDTGYYHSYTEYYDDGKTPSRKEITGNNLTFSQELGEHVGRNGRKTTNYDENGNITYEEITTKNNETISYTYNSKGLKTEYNYDNNNETNPIVTNMKYDTNGHLQSSEQTRDGKTTTTSYGYDETNKTSYMTGKTIKEGITTTDVYTFRVGGDPNKNQHKINDNSGGFVTYACSPTGKDDKENILERKVYIDDDPNDSVEGVYFQYDQEGHTTIPSKYSNQGYTFTPTIIDAIAENGKIPEVTDNTTSTDSNYYNMLESNDSTDPEMLVIKGGTQFQYDLSPGGNSYDINVTHDKDTAYIIKHDANGNKIMVNAEDPDEWYYASVLTTTGYSMKHNGDEGQNFTLEQLKDLRSQYPAFAEYEKNGSIDKLSNQETAAIIGSSFDGDIGLLIRNQQFDSNPIKPSSVTAYPTDGSTDAIASNALTGTTNYNINRGAIKWSVYLPDKYANVEFTYQPLNGGKEYRYLYWDGSNYYMFDPITQQVYKQG